MGRGVFVRGARDGEREGRGATERNPRFPWMIGGGERKREREGEGCEARRNEGFRFDISARGGHES